jgi:hypothetical protein
LLAIGPGPDGGGSKKNQLRPHIPDKSGIDATGAAVCPKASAHPKSVMPVNSISVLCRFMNFSCYRTFRLIARAHSYARLFGWRSDVRTDFIGATALINDPTEH